MEANKDSSIDMNSNISNDKEKNSNTSNEKINYFSSKTSKNLCIMGLLLFVLVGLVIFFILRHSLKNKNDKYNKISKKIFTEAALNKKIFLLI